MTFYSEMSVNLVPPVKQRKFCSEAGDHYVYFNGDATMSKMFRNCARMLLVFVCMFAVSAPVFSQELMLDEMVEAGGLKMFPVYGDATKFYYLPDKVTIPNGPDGKPQFSFLKFARNEAGDGEGGIQKGQGGGLVSFLVNFELSDSERRNAEGELQSKVPGATLVGPLNYKSGTFALISNFQQEGGDWTTRIVGLGKAPVMEGHKAAVSIRLTAEGATILWESFKQAASDISVSFEMVITGYRNPYEMEMTAHWDKIASNRTMAAGLKTTWVGVDIQNTMKQLREEGAIEVKVKGEDEQMDKMWSMAYGMLAKQMFEPDNAPTTLATLQDDPNLYSNFDKANALNTQERDRVTKENEIERDRVAQENNAARNLVDKLNATTRKNVIETRRKVEAEVAALMGEDGKPKPLTPEAKALAEKRVDSANKALDSAIAANSAEKSGATDPVEVKTQSAGASANKPPITQVAKEKIAKLETPPSFALMASYRKKEFKKTGTYHLSFTRALPDTQAMRFDENIGGFGKAMLNDKGHFRIINLDDPAYDQREILVQLDGQDAEDFNQFVNFVAVSLRKKHQDGSTTVRELKIDKSNFIGSSNNFRMVYGNKGDSDRDQWLSFDYRIVWSLHGGLVHDSGWQEYTDGSYVITVGAPYQYREVTVDADPEMLADRDVRLVTLTFRSSLFGKDQTQQVTFKTSGAGSLSQIIKYAHLPGDYEYDYEIVWRIRGGETVSSGPLKSAESTIFADELP